MQIKLVINGFDAGPWLKESGLSQTKIVRTSRSVITLDGVKRQAEIIKDGMTADFVEMRDASWQKILNALSVRPAEVTYTGDDLSDKTAYFWISNLAATAKVVRGGITYFSGCTVTFEEM